MTIQIGWSGWVPMIFINCKCFTSLHYYVGAIHQYYLGWVGKDPTFSIMLGSFFFFVKDVGFVGVDPSEREREIELAPSLPISDIRCWMEETHNRNH